MVLAGQEDKKENDTKSTGVENDVEITGVLHNDKITGVDSDNENMELVSKGATDKADEMALIEEAIAEEERDIAEGTDLLAGTETKTEDARNKNVIHPDLQVPTVEHTYKLRRRQNPRPDYTNSYGFQAMIIHYSLTELSIKRELNKFKQKGKKVVTAELKQLSQERRIPTSEYREPNRTI